MINTLQRVFAHPRYSLLAASIALLVIVSTILLPNRTSIGQVLSSDAVGFADKFSYLWAVLGSLQTNFTAISASYLFVVALLFGVNIALLVFYIRKRQVRTKNKNKAQLIGLGGSISALLGIGCAACGSIILSALFGLFGAGSLIAFFPLHGLEFGLLGVALLTISNFYLLKRINDPLVCPAD